MPTMTMRLDETDAEVVRKYAEFEGKRSPTSFEMPSSRRSRTSRTSQLCARRSQQTPAFATPTSRYSRSWACKCPTTLSTATQPSSN